MGTYYEPSWLVHTGLKLCIGHGGDPCPLAESGDNLTAAPGADNYEDRPDGTNDPLDNDRTDIPQEEDDPVSDTLQAMSAAPSMGMVPNKGTAPGMEAVETPIFQRTPSPDIEPGIKTRNKAVCLSWHAGIYSPPNGCPTRAPESAKFMTIVDRSGIHQVQVEFCRCPGAEFNREKDMLQAGLFPTSYKIIKSAFTFQVLDDFRLANLECKTSAYHYYQKLCRMTSPAFPTAVPVQYFISCRNLH